MKELYLIYINKIGTNYKNNYVYEFLFSNTDNPKDIDGEEWDTFPASGRPLPPNEIFINKVGNLETELNLEVVQNSDTFAVWDAIDGVVPLAYENINAYDSYPDKRLHFHFGLSVDEVTDKLYTKDLVLKFKNKDEK